MNLQKQWCTNPNDWPNHTFTTINNQIIRISPRVPASFFHYAIYLLINARRAKNDALSREFIQTIIIKHPVKANLFTFIIGLLIHPLSAHFLIGSAIQIAHWLRLSELVMGLTIISIGTCLSNIATSMVAALKGQDDIAVM